MNILIDIESISKKIDKNMTIILDKIFQIVFKSFSNVFHIAFQLIIF